MAKLLRDCLVLSAIAALLAAAFGAVHPDFQQRRTDRHEQLEVSPATARSWGESVLWVDARPMESFGKGHLAGAIQLNATTWEDHLPVLLERWSPSRKVIVYCDNLECNLSAEVARRLRREAGFTEVWFLRGDWRAWQRGNP